jgi:hypothetical protein
MFIQNSNMNGVELRLRNGATVIGDPEGIFEVDDETGLILLQTKYWKETDKAPQQQEDIDPVAALKKLKAMQGSNQTLHTPPQPPAPVTAAPAPAPAPVTPEPAEPEPPEPPAEEGPDLSTMSKSQLLAVAEEYEIAISPDLRKGKVDNLRAHLDKELYGG